ncbi:MAG: DUF58 domain-containing protein [Lachnospiraceae bacterium]|nr:DUF58 domain-containing protein [Lachnospiraceae bacterium]
MRAVKRLLWIGALALALTGISLSAGAVTYCFLWVVLAIPVVCYAYMICVIFTLKIYQKTEGRNMISNTPSDFYITLQNEGWLPVSSVQLLFYSTFSTISGLSDHEVYELMPHEAVRKKTQMLCKYRGEYKVGVKKIVIRDFLDLFSITVNMREPLNVIVAPARVSLEKENAGELLKQMDRESALNKQAIAMTVREYVPSDDPRLIHWGATATSQKLMVRELTGEAKNHIAILVDKQRPSGDPAGYLPPENKIVELVIALADHYLQNRIPVDVYYLTDRACRTNVNDNAGFTALYSAMTEYLFRTDTDQIMTIRALCENGSLAGCRQIIWVGFDPGENGLDLLRQAGLGEASILAYLVEKDRTENVVAQADRDTTIIRTSQVSLMWEVTA